VTTVDALAPAALQVADESAEQAAALEPSTATQQVWALSQIEQSAVVPDVPALPVEPAAPLLPPLPDVPAAPVVPPVPVALVPPAPELLVDWQAGIDERQETICEQSTFRQAL